MNIDSSHGYLSVENGVVWTGVENPKVIDTKVVQSKETDDMQKAISSTKDQISI